jgi:hypothetical protein
MFGYEEARTLKDALYNTIHRHPRLTVEQIAEQLDMSSSYLYRSCLPDLDTDGPNASGVRFMLKKLVPLIRVTGDMQVMDLMERELGRVAVHIPPATPEQPSKDLERQALNAAKEFGELMQEVYESTKDQELQPDEKKRIVKEGYEAIQAIMALIIRSE